MKKSSRKQKLDEKSPATKTAEDIVDNTNEEEITITLSGDVPAKITNIQASSMKLVAVCGEGPGDDAVLVPLVDWQMFGRRPDSREDDDSDDHVTQIGSHLIALDNLAFLLRIIGADTLDVVRLFVALAKGGVSPVESRTRLMARMLRGGAEYMNDAAELIEVELLKDETS